jgi:hypothetical protein
MDSDGQRWHHQFEGNSKVKVEHGSSQPSDYDKCIDKSIITSVLPSSLYKYPPHRLFRQFIRKGIQPHHLLVYTHIHIHTNLTLYIMSGFKNFAIVGAGNVGGFIVEELLKQKAAGSVNEVTIVSRPVRRPPNRPSSHKGGGANDQSPGFPRQGAKQILCRPGRAHRGR